MNYRSYSDLSKLLKQNLHKINSKDIDLIVGIPRSGMIPAYMIALYLNVNCIDLQSFLDNKKLLSGRTRRISNNLSKPDDASNILLVDDSIRTGKSMEETLKKIPEIMQSKITTLVIYSSIPKRKDVDIILEYLELPRVFEWNIFHHSSTKKAAFDIDGVICQDPKEDENDDGVRYKNFLANAKPLIISDYKIHSLVTNRLEKYREETVEWLDENNVLYENLIMLDLPTKEERQRLGIHAKHKADYYKKSGLELFIESAPRQAAKIAELAGKSVYCISNNKMYQPGITSKFSKQPRKTIKETYKSLRNNLASILNSSSIK